MTNKSSERTEKIIIFYIFFVDNLYKCTILYLYICKIYLSKESCYDKAKIAGCKPGRD